MDRTKVFSNFDIAQSQSASFGFHRNMDRPASALQATMPPARSTRGVQTAPLYPRQDEAVRSFVDIGLDPFRWIMASKLRKTCAGVCLTVAAYSLIV